MVAQVVPVLLAGGETKLPRQIPRMEFANSISCIPNATDSLPGAGPIGETVFSRPLSNVVNRQNRKFQCNFTEFVEKSSVDAVLETAAGTADMCRSSVVWFCRLEDTRFI